MMRLLQVAVTAAFIGSGAYLGLCAGQIVSYFLMRLLLRRSLGPTTPPQS